MQKRNFALLLIAPLLWAAPAAAGDVYYWVTEAGVHSYSDSLKQVPNRYRAEARKSRLGSLATYERWTASDRVKEGDYVRRLPTNLTRLRAFNAAAERRDVPGTAEQMTLQLGRTGSNIQLALPARSADRESRARITARAEESATAARAVMTPS